VIRSANTGISGFIDSRGRIIDESDIFVEAVLTEDIYAGDEKSFYARNGDVFACFCMAVFLLLVILNKSEVLKDVLRD
jgi:apolipoprotein N-acyltransferase